MSRFIGFFPAVFLIAACTTGAQGNPELAKTTVSGRESVAQNGDLVTEGIVDFAEASTVVLVLSHDVENFPKGTRFIGKTDGMTRFVRLILVRTPDRATMTPIPENTSLLAIPTDNKTVLDQASRFVIGHQ